MRNAVLCWLVLLSSVCLANPFVHSQGTRLVDGDGEALYLRGVLLEGWLQWNGRIMGAGLTSETEELDRLELLLGARGVEEFRLKVYDRFITEDDIAAIAKLGMNCVRVPINHRCLDDDSGWPYLDRLMDWCERHRVYVILDLHSAPGGQSGVFVCDPEHPNLWASKANKDRTVELWRELALRYRDRKIVAGYDLINEPAPPWGGAELLELYTRLIKEIREVDPHHLIILEGTHLAMDFSLFKERPDDQNIAYSFHTYNFLNDETCERYLGEFLQLSRRQNVPIINGEFGAHTLAWTQRTVDLFEDPKNGVRGWIFWPWKAVPDFGKPMDRFRGLNSIERRDKFGYLATWIAFPGLPKPSSKDALEGLDQFLEASRAAKLQVDSEIKAVLSR